MTKCEFLRIPKPSSRPSNIPAASDQNITSGYILQARFGSSQSCPGLFRNQTDRVTEELNILLPQAETIDV